MQHHGGDVLILLSSNTKTKYNAVVSTLLFLAVSSKELHDEFSLLDFENRPRCTRPYREVHDTMDAQTM
jgi:hypothetical protein